METRLIYKSILDKSTFDDLINSGVLENLTNSELKNKILGIPSNLEKINEIYILAKDVWDDFQLPYLMKHSNVSGNWDIIRGVKITKPNFKRNKSAFIYNKDYASILSLRTRMIGNYEVRLSGVKDELKIISEMIENYLKVNK